MSKIIPKTFKMWGKTYHFVNYVNDINPKTDTLCVYKTYSKRKKTWYFHVELAIDLARTLAFIKESNKDNI